MFSKPVLKLAMRTSAVALAMALPYAGPAKAYYPGEVWSIDALVIKGATMQSGISASKLRTALQSANDTYFFGELSMRMVAAVLPGDTSAVRLTLIEQTTGDLLARSPKMDVSKGVSGLKSQALAWMESLNCLAEGCAVAPEVEQPVRVAKSRLDVGSTLAHNERITGTATEGADFGVPVPVRRPGSEPVSGKRGKARIYPSGLSAKELNAALSTLQIALAIPREVAALTYNDADRLVLDDAVQLARATPALSVAATPVRPVRTIPTGPTYRENRSLFVRLVDGFADLFTIGPAGRQPSTAVATRQPSQPAVSATQSADALAIARPSAPTAAALVDPTTTVERQTVATPTEPAEVVEPTETEVAVAQPTEASAPTIRSIVQPARTRSAWTRASDAVTLINPIERFRRDPTLRGVSDGERIAVADIRARLTDPANVRASQLSAGAVTPGELLRPDPRDASILSARSQPTRQTPTQLSVRLHPELLGRYSAPALAGLTPRRNQRLKKASTDASAPAPTDTTNLNAVLKERGLELNLAGYNRFERIYWGGEGDEGYWISLPNRVNSKFVLVSGPTSSVIAAVRRRSGVARASKGVAEALELKPREWSKLRIISLRSDNQSAERPFLVWSSVLKGRNVAVK